MFDAFRQAWWLRGCHAQTIGAQFLHRVPTRHFTFRRERVILPDGDFVDLDWVDHDEQAPLVFVLHGLEGSARASYALHAYHHLGSHGLAAVGFNFRSCSGEPNRLARMYHSGDTADFAFVVDRVRGHWPNRPLAAIGFSLGGNVLLKYLGTSTPSLTAAVAVSVPYDLSVAADTLDRGLARRYQQYFLRSLRRKIRAKAAVLTTQIDIPRVLHCRTLRDFDQWATAPVHGFSSADDYYEKSSSAQFLHRITVPTLLIHACNDPFLPRQAMPRAAVEQNQNLSAWFCETGGHVGFVGGSPWSPTFFAQQNAAAFLAEKLYGTTSRMLRS